MARIFYFSDTGDIYGVHPGAFDGELPAGVEHIDVPGQPHEIPWPQTASGYSGEHFARVQGGALVPVDREPLGETPERRAIRTLADRVGPQERADVDDILSRGASGAGKS